MTDQSNIDHKVRHIEENLCQWEKRASELLSELGYPADSEDERYAEALQGVLSDDASKESSQPSAQSRELYHAYNLAVGIEWMIPHLQELLRQGDFSGVAYRLSA